MFPHAADAVYSICRSIFSGKDLMYNVAMHVRKAEVSSLCSKCQAFVVEPHEVENGSVQIMDLDGVDDSIEAEVVGLAV